MKIHAFNSNNIGLYFLSPYTEFRTDDGIATFYHSLFDKSVAFEIKDNASMERFLDSIGHGTDEPMCLSLIGKAFKSDNPSEILINLMQTGIIE
ncbi:MAG: hypothetical protein IPH20_12920 [Bacteroidales bacterium]|nr:hypothetical protein [Bacteroidales bacterium]